MSSPTNKWK